MRQATQAAQLLNPRLAASFCRSRLTEGRQRARTETSSRSSSPLASESGQADRSAASGTKARARTEIRAETRADAREGGHPARRPPREARNLHDQPADGFAEPAA